MPDPNPTVAALLASGRRELAAHRVTTLRKPKPPKDTAVTHADDPQPPMPTEGAPYAYVLVERTHSPYADRPEWDRGAIVIPEWSSDELDHWRDYNSTYTLIPIGPDGDTGTRAITEPRRIGTVADLDDLPPLSIVLAMSQAFTAVDGFGRSWCAYGLAFSNSSAELLALNGGSVTVLHTPAEVSS